MKELCVYCNQPANDNAMVLTGEFGEWKNKQIVAYNSQCLIRWDTSSLENHFNGAQALDLAKVFKYDV